MEDNTLKEQVIDTTAGSKRSSVLEHVRNACLQKLDMTERSGCIEKSEEFKVPRVKEMKAHSVKRNFKGDPVNNHDFSLSKTVNCATATEIRELLEGNTQAESTITTQSDKTDIVSKNITLGINATAKQGSLNEISELETIKKKPNEGTQDNESESQAPESSADPTDVQPHPENFRIVLAGGSNSEIHTLQTNKIKKVELEAPYTGPVFYDVHENFVTPSLIIGRLSEAFESLSIFTQPHTGVLDKHKMLRDFVERNMDEERFEKLVIYCSTEHLRTGCEITMESKETCTGLSSLKAIMEQVTTVDADGAAELSIQRHHRLLTARDRQQLLHKNLKYRGVRFIEPNPDLVVEGVKPSPPLVPGKDTVFRVRLYRPFLYSPREKKKSSGNRHPIFVCDLLLLGRHSLAELRDRIACTNDEGLRLDLSARPDARQLTSCKELFPSGFLCINNVFYNDRRVGCLDYSAPIREWARRRGLGDFRAADMGAVRLDQLTLRLGHPEVYVHQGNCEHLFTFSEVRLLGLDEPQAALYPSHRTAVGYNCVYCTTCAEFPANWIVTGSTRVPFDPALFCDNCFRLYMYKDGEKIGDFKAIPYTGNGLQTLTASL